MNIMNTLWFRIITDTYLGLVLELFKSDSFHGIDALLWI